MTCPHGVQRKERCPACIFANAAGGFFLIRGQREAPDKFEMDAFNCLYCGETVVAPDAPKKCEACGMSPEDAHKALKDGTSDVIDQAMARLIGVLRANGVTGIKMSDDGKQILKMRIVCEPCHREHEVTGDVWGIVCRCGRKMDLFGVDKKPETFGQILGIVEDHPWGIPFYQRSSGIDKDE